jgi:hypothetical protein
LIEAKGFVYDDLHGVGSDRLSGRYVAAGREGNVVDGLTLLTVRNLNSIKEKLRKVLISVVVVEKRQKKTEERRMWNSRALLGIVGTVL